MARTFPCWLVVTAAVAGVVMTASAWAEEGLTGAALNKALARRQLEIKQAEKQSHHDSGGSRVTAKGGETQVRAESGDVVRVAGRRYRLWGVAAPAPSEFGGYTAWQGLIQLVDDGPVICAPTGDIMNGLPVARCKAGEDDISAALVAGGFARDCPVLSRGAYATIERLVVTDVAAGFQLPPECLDE
jgi:hypothetical protein